MAFVTRSQLYLAKDSIRSFLPLMTHLQKSSLLFFQPIVIFSSNHPLSILMPSLQKEWMLLSSSWVAHPSLHTSSLHLTSVRSSLIQPNWPPESNNSLPRRGVLVFWKHISWSSLFFRSASCGFCPTHSLNNPSSPLLKLLELLPHLPQNFRIPLVKHVEYFLLFPMNNLFVKNKAFYIWYHLSKDDSFKNHKFFKK